jgi:hypothetical protein
LGIGLGAVLVAAVVLIAGAYTFLPAFVEGVFSRAVQERLGLENAPEVTLDSDPALNILAGKFDSGRLILQGADFDGIRPEKTVINLESFDLKVLSSTFSRRLASEKPLSGALRMELSEDEVTRLAKMSSNGIALERVRLQLGEMTVGVQATVMGVRVPVSVAGGLDLEGEALIFEPRRISAFGIALPDRLSDRIVARAGFEYPLGDLAYDTEVSEIRVEDGKVIVIGRMNRILLGETSG